MLKWFAERDKVALIGAAALFLLLAPVPWAIFNLPGTTHWVPLNITDAFIVWGILGLGMSTILMLLGSAKSGPDKMLTWLGLAGSFLALAAMFYGILQWHPH